MSTAGWANGVYMITASYGDKVSCGASTNTPCLAVTAPGQFAFDGAVPARHTVQDMGQTSFGVVVAPAPNSKNTYQDELNVVTASYPELEPQRFHAGFRPGAPLPQASWAVVGRSDACC
jgi:hypothetical protein